MNVQNRLEGENGERRYGMRLADLTDSVLVDVVQLYDRVVGIHKGPSPKRATSEVAGMVSRINESVANSGFWEYRFGSRLTNESKLFVEKPRRADGSDTVRFRFDPNVSGPLTGHPDEKQLIDDFRDEVQRYLIEHGMAVEI